MIYNLVIVRDTSGDVAMDTTFYLRPPVVYDFGVGLSYVYTLRLIGPISYPGECDLMVNPQKYIVIFSRMHLVTFVRI